MFCKQALDLIFTIWCGFSREEVLSMQEFAKSRGMEVIPLVQTFGHMEVRLTLISLSIRTFVM